MFPAVVEQEAYMSKNDFQRVEALFQAAADLPAAEREPFLERECDGNIELLSRVRRLLDRLGQETALPSPLGDRSIADPTAESDPITEGPGTIIDRYKLLQKIGDGGFGVVYMAQQQEPIVRKVAVKIIKLGMDTREVVARFEAERQALALLDHPNIAKVLDGGTTTSGRPYFVMELVRGVSITEFCDKNDLSTRDRLNLFLRVCQAVQHAHQKGVIHRDLKPSNVLVTLHDGEPTPKVIDFGIAKSLHTRLTEKTLFTRFEQFVGTPAYMSPEQAEMSALDVDTRTDIYSLGVLLYELLTGSTPFDTTTLKQAGLLEIQRIIREEQPPRPSMRVSSSQGEAASVRGLDIAALSRSLRGDLDWIVMKALEKDRSRRYASAGEFAEDVRRHMTNEPVIAGPPRARYRFRKFLARNRAAMLSVCLIGVALIIGIIATTAAMVQSRRHAREMDKQANLAMTAVDYLLSTLSLTNPSVALNPEVTVLTLLEDASTRVNNAFADDPGIEARVRATIGRAYATLGKHDLAEPHLRRVIEIVDASGNEADAIGPELRAAGFGDMAYYHALWTLTNVCFNLERSDSFAMASRSMEVGFDYIQETEPELADRLRKFSGKVEAGAWSHASDAMQGVPALFTACVEEANAAFAQGDPRWAIVSDTFLAAGYTLWYTPHETLAESFWSGALDIQRRELPSSDPVIANTVSLLVGLLNKAGKVEQSESLIRESIAVLKQVHQDGALALATAQGMLGETLVIQGRFEEAEPILLRSYDDTLTALKSDMNWMVLEAAIRLLDLYDSWGKPEKTRPYSDTLATAAARSRYVMQWVFSRGAFIPDYPGLVAAGEQVKQKCGGVSFVAKPGVTKSAELKDALDEFLAQRNAIADEASTRSFVSARLLLGWGNALDPVAHLDARCRMAQDALRSVRHWGESNPLDLAENLAVLAECARSDGRTEEAKQYAADAWQALSNGWESGDWFVGSQQVRIARAMLQEGMHAPAEELLIPAYEMMHAQLGDGHPETQLTLGLIRDLYTKSGRPRLAAEYAAKLEKR